MTAKILVLFGTRPEAIKLQPVVRALRDIPGTFETLAISTGQHREMLAETLAVFGLEPDGHLDVMTEGQDLFDVSTRVLEGLKETFSREKPDLVICQGDTTTTFMSALSAFYLRVPVAHVEAGLRSGDVYDPYPEEANRRSVSVYTRFHFAPTENSRDHLLREGIPHEHVYVTGNTVIDALYGVLAQDKRLPSELETDPSKKTVLITFHRRESFGEPIKRMCAAVRELAEKYEGRAEWIFPVHLNPNVRSVVRPALGDLPGVRLVNPQPYDVFARLMNQSYMILSDSGGVQEEATALGKPVLVLREKTERPEVMASGAGKLIGVKTDRIIKEASLLLDGGEAYEKMAKKSEAFGDGRASVKIAEILKAEHEQGIF